MKDILYRRIPSNKSTGSDRDRKSKFCNFYWTDRADDYDGTIRKKMMGDSTEEESSCHAPLLLSKINTTKVCLSGFLLKFIVCLQCVFSTLGSDFFSFILWDLYFLFYNIVEY